MLRREHFIGRNLKGLEGEEMGKVIDFDYIGIVCENNRRMNV
jgi:hypothetical protein